MAHFRGGWKKFHHVSVNCVLFNICSVFLKASFKLIVNYICNKDKIICSCKSVFLSWTEIREDFFFSLKSFLQYVTNLMCLKFNSVTIFLHESSGSDHSSIQTQVSFPVYGHMYVLQFPLFCNVPFIFPFSSCLSQPGNNKAFWDLMLFNAKSEIHLDFKEN